MPKILLGYEASSAHSAQRREVYADFDRLVNPHMMITGDSGTGKTHMVRQAITSAIGSSREPLRVHVMDVHGDIELDTKMCSEVLFSESSPFGFNPLKVNPDPHFGGVRKCIQNFISTLRLSPTTSRALGPKQQDVLRNLLTDVFSMNGFDENEPESWDIQHRAVAPELIPGRTYINVDFSEKELAKNAAKVSGIYMDWDKETRCWHVDKYEGPITRWPVKLWGKTNPTLNTLVQYATRRREMSFTGLGQKEAALMEIVHRRARALSGRLQQHAKAHNNGGESGDADTAIKELDKAKNDALGAFKDYISTIEHGGALDALIKYDSFESLSTVKQILDSLNSSGIFRDTPPNFDPKKPVWRYNIKALRAEEQKFLVNVRLREIFYNAVQRGESKHLREVIVIDEGAKFVEDDEDHIVNIIALEARKFGLGIWFASQSPTQYPDALLSTVATKIVLGLDPNYWPVAQRRLRIDEKAMKWIRPREGLLVNFKLSGQSAQPWHSVITPSVVHGGAR